MASWEDHTDAVYAAKCELDKAIADAFFDGGMFPNRLKVVTGYYGPQIIAILAKDPRFDPDVLARVKGNASTSAPSPLAMPKRRPAHEAKPDVRIARDRSNLDTWRSRNT